MTTHERPDNWENSIHRAVRPLRGRRGREGVTQYVSGEMPADGRVEIHFDARGDYSPSSVGCVAKRVQTERTDGFYVLFGTAGPDQGRMLNPMGLYFDPADLHREDVRRGRARYEFKKVSESAFKDYLRFLQTRTEAFLRNAERQVLDG